MIVRPTVLLLSVACLCPPREIPAQTAQEHHRRADLALQTFLLEFWDPGLDYLGGSWPPTGETTGYWTFAQGFDALLDGVERTGGRQYAGLVETFFEAQERRGWIVGYYDDENWMALVLIRAFDLLGREEYLEVAQMLFQDIMMGWDQTCCGSAPGGIWWNKGHSQKATASNAGPVITAIRLHERTGDASYLNFAERVYTYWMSNMMEPDHQVLDHINPDGQKIDWRFTYNEGLMIGAAVELFRISGREQFRTHALNILDFIIREEVVSSSGGWVLSDGSNSSCGGDCHAFKGIAYRYLMELFRITGDARARGILEGSAKSIWELARNPETNLFSVSWTGPPLFGVSEPQVAAAVMALNIFAGESGPYPGAGLEENRHEAENATIRGLDLDASQGGFTGWGYVTGWDRHGQAVEFSIELPDPGEYMLGLRYAAGGGDARRRLDVNGQVLSRNLLFPATGSWSAYGDVAMRIFLPGGRNSISLAFDAARGSAGSLALDSITLDHIDLPLFLRGDTDSNGRLDVSDVIRFLNFQFLGSGSLDCPDAADMDDGGVLDLTDAIWNLNYQFTGTAPAPEPPGPFQCGPDVGEDDLPPCEYPPESCVADQP